MWALTMSACRGDEVSRARQWRLSLPVVRWCGTCRVYMWICARVRIFLALLVRLGGSCHCVFRRKGQLVNDLSPCPLFNRMCHVSPARPPSNPVCVPPGLSLPISRVAGTEVGNLMQACLSKVRSLNLPPSPPISPSLAPLFPCSFFLPPSLPLAFSLLFSLAHSHSLALHPL